METKGHRQRMRNCLFTLAPKGNDVKALHAARSISRLVAPDYIFQHFNREGSTRSLKKSLKNCYPRIDQIITSVIMATSKVGLEQSRSGLSGHLAKCSDRRISKKMQNAAQ